MPRPTLILSALFSPISSQFQHWWNPIQPTEFLPGPMLQAEPRCPHIVEETRYFAFSLLGQIEEIFLLSRQALFVSQHFQFFSFEMMITGVVQALGKLAHQSNMAFYIPAALCILNHQLCRTLTSPETNCLHDQEHAQHFPLKQQHLI